MEDTQYPAVVPDPGGWTFWRRILLTLLILIGFIAIAIPLRELRDGARLASCRPHSIRWVADGYSLDHDGMYPPLSPTPGRLMFVEGAEEPYAGAGLRVDFICESDSQRGIENLGYPGAPVDDWSYIYLGYLIENQAQLELFAESYKRTIAESGDFTQDIKVAAGQGNCGTDTIYRLRDLITLVAMLPCLEGRFGDIPLVIEWPENHRGPVAKVVSLAPGSRGEVMPYPGEWPMTEAAIGVLRELDALGTDPSHAE